MVWRDRLQLASFRNVNFFTESHSFSGSRNIATYEFPGSEDFATDDLGKKVNSYSISAYIFGDDYMEQRDALLSAVQEPGSGTLIHTYLGNLEVFCSTWSLSENDQEGRFAKIDLTFIPVGTTQIENVANNGNTFIQNQVSNINTFSSNNFSAGIQITNVPEFVRSGVTNRIIDFGALINDELGAFFSETAILSDNTQQQNYASLFYSLSNLANPIVSTSADIINQVQNIFDLVNVVSNDGNSARRIFRAIRNLDYIPAAEITNNRITENQNAAVTKNYLQINAVINEALALTNIDFESLDEANAARDDVIAQINYLQENSLYGDEYQQLQELKNLLVLYVPDDNQKLANIQTIVIADTEPVILTSYRLYGNTDKIEDITKRNKLVHAGFIPRAKQLQVLIDG